MNGARVALVTGADGSLGSTICDRLRGYGFVVHGLRAGLEGRAEIEAALDEFDVRYFDVVILNDGTNNLAPIGGLSESAEHIMRVNFHQPMWVANWLARTQPKHPLRMVAISSQTYRVPQRNTSVYCASKAALTHFMRVIAREKSGIGWIVNTLAPGKIVDTVMSDMTDAQVLAQRGWTHDEAERYALSLIPAGRFTSREEVAEAVVWLLLAPPYINGATIDMMGAA
jgi:NAD(P)-dependent dehydrogenase (short-subunit alcohol dehydrogenase family)